MTPRPRPIKDYCLGIYDGPHATPQESSDGPIFLGIKNITDDGRLDFSEIRHVSEEEFSKWTRRVTPQANDVVFTYEATLHRYALIPEGFRGCLGRRVALVRPNPNQVDSRYLLYFFLSDGWREVMEGNVISGAAVERIPLEKFPSFPAALPILSMQRKVADILSAYDDLIENNRRRMALLEEAARHLYREWFVRLRFPGHEHSRITDGVPEGWEFKPIGEVATLNYGKALKEENRLEGATPVYGSSGVVGSHSEAFVSGPGIVVGRKGNVGSVFWSDTPFWPIDTVYFVSPEESSLFLFHCLRQVPFQSSDVAVPGLNRTYAHGLKILIPSRKLWTEFDQAITPMFEQLTKLRTMNQKLRAARDVLLPRLMSGEIAV